MCNYAHYMLIRWSLPKKVPINAYYRNTKVTKCVNQSNRKRHIDNLMNDNQKRIRRSPQVNKGYPSKHELVDDTKLLTFYTGFNSVIHYIKVHYGLSHTNNQ